MNWKNAGENRFWGWFRALAVEIVLSIVGLRYCLSRKFLQFELRRRLTYLFCSPWAISRYYLEQRGEVDAQGYGETPLVTLEAVGRRLQLTAEDVLLELGSGTGRNCVWLADRYGCAAVGVEQIPPYVGIARRLVRSCFAEGRISFVCDDMFALDMSRWRFVYVDCTAMSEACIRELALLCAALPDSAKLVTVNASMGRLMPERFQLETAFPGLFIWGWSDIRIYRVGPPEAEWPDGALSENGIGRKETSMPLI